MDRTSAFRGRDPSMDRAAYVDRVVRGGFPEAVARSRPEAHRRWLINYADRVADRGLANDITAGRDAVRTYLELLERVFLVRRLPSFSRNTAAKMTPHPKLHMTDTGLAAALIGADATALRRSAALGPLLETFVFSELLKQQGWARTETRLSHYRTRDGHEVDIVLETPDGRVVGIEIKAASSVDRRDLGGLQHLASALGSAFVHGVVLYTGPESIRFDTDGRFSARPVLALWRPIGE
jgi:uncharacterized protein